MSDYQGCLLSLRALKEKHGYADYDAAVRTINRERLLTRNRGVRISWKWWEYKRLYLVQRGKCGICGDDMPLIRGAIEMDHKDPNSKDFEASSNRQVVHQRCNREKSSKSIQQQSKETGKGFTELL